MRPRPSAAEYAAFSRHRSCQVLAFGWRSARQAFHDGSDRSSRGGTPAAVGGPWQRDNPGDQPSSRPANRLYSSHIKRNARIDPTQYAKTLCCRTLPPGFIKDSRMRPHTGDSLHGLDAHRVLEQSWCWPGDLDVRGGWKYQRLELGGIGVAERERHVDCRREYGFLSIRGRGRRQLLHHRGNTAGGINLCRQQWGRQQRHHRYHQRPHRVQRDHVQRRRLDRGSHRQRPGVAEQRRG